MPADTCREAVWLLRVSVGLSDRLWALNLALYVTEQCVFRQVPPLCGCETSPPCVTERAQDVLYANWARDPTVLAFIEIVSSAK